MKTIGIVGGMSWESSAEYYRLINERVKSCLGPSHSAELAMYSVDFHLAAQLEQEERWEELAIILVDAATRLEKAGADFVMMASNTAHKVADAVQAEIDVPLLHIAEVTAAEIVAAGITKVGLLGTRFVMEQNFYKERLSARGIQVLVPKQGDRDSIHEVIFTELCVGKLLSESKKKIQSIMVDLKKAGAMGVVLACTELPLLIRLGDTPMNLFDTMALHVKKAVALSLEG